MMTKKELLKAAAKFDVQGRSKMSKEELLKALSIDMPGLNTELDSDTDDDPDVPDTLDTPELNTDEPDPDPDNTEPDSTDTNGHSFDPFEGNFIYTKPWRQRHYRVVGFNKEAYDGAPPQCKAIYDYMKKHNVSDIGAKIVTGAIKHGYIKTRQKPEILYAYYARKLENIGVSLA